MPNEIVVVTLAAGLPACLVRLWWIWWQSTCLGCGYQHRTCVCPSDEHMMRPRR